MQRLNAFRAELERISNGGQGNGPALDRYLGMNDHTREDDLEISLRAIRDAGLLKLQAAIADGRVVPGSYGCNDDRGCVFHFALGFNHNRDLFEWDVPDDVMSAVSRTMRRFDYGQVTLEQVSAAVADELLRRNATLTASCQQPDPWQSPAAASVGVSA